MKVCIIGSGAQGTGLGALLAKESDVEQITLADASAQAADKALKLIQSLEDQVKVKDVRTEVVDASSRSDVARVARGSDIVVNATFPSCNIPIMEACLDVGSHYLDFAGAPFSWPGGDRKETIGAQLDLDASFKDAGLIAIPSVGVSPGWTDLAARYLVDQLETVDTVIVRFGDWFDSTDLIACFAPGRMFGEWFGPPYSVCIEDGQVKQVDLLQSEEIYEFPAPVGRLMLHTVTRHSELATIPMFCGKPVRHIEEKGGLHIGTWNARDVWVEVIRRQTSTHVGAENMLALFGESFIHPTRWKEAQDEGIVKDGAVCFSVEVTGTLGGETARYTAFNTITLQETRKHLPWAPHGVYATIGAVPIELILRLGRGEIEERGVIGVATLANYRDILKGVARRGHQLTEKLERATILQ